jgi:hypothetical protein
MRPVAVAVLGLLACEHIDEAAELAGPAMPASTVEAQKLNVDEIGPKVVRHAGVAPVTPSIADPNNATVPRHQVSAFEDAPPPEPIVLTAPMRWFLSLSAGDRKTVREICREGRNDPCFGMLPMPRNTPPSKMHRLLVQLADQVENRHMVSHAVHDYCRERDPSLVCDTPLVVSFDGRVEFEPSTASFAFGETPTRNDWPTAATPWIALDRDGDGAITSGAELFGDATDVPGGKASNGFEALAALDANRDGVIDRRDPAFASLVLWSDTDGDRKSSPGELRPLGDVIEELPLAYSTVPRCVRGNCEGERASMTWRDGDGRRRAGAVIDVYLSRR